ncbi:hypothetical protein Clacol_001029 [Clathrus columnatus]|uniref:Uncharacterized protein n=1 Tax=Clathrus columnatus TaxID=1419009 RepID=A0AAV5A0U7_9AGAM|nr:hypothetical protein Clacol_001029 [Clathrus columnatus]
MANSEDDYYYDFRVPTASSIYPRFTCEETFSALLQANESRPVHKRFPVEILLLVNDELHPPPNSVYEEIRSIWTVDAQFNYPDAEEDCLNYLLFDTNTKMFCIPKLSLSERVHGRLRHQDEHHISKSISAADLLYRVRCFFPNVPVKSEGPEGYKWMWTAAVRHKQSGIRLELSESVGAAIAIATWRAVDMLYNHPHNSHNSEYDDEGSETQPILQSENAEVFTTDALHLLNTLFGTIDGKRFIYYHPAADADYPTADERFLAVPRIWKMEHVKNENRRIYKQWCPVPISAADLSFKSLLPDLKYNVKSRKVDPMNGTADLTTVLSSSLLFYRLLCHYVWPFNNVNVTPPITSVWQVKLQHIPYDDFPFHHPTRNRPFIIFMDNRGFFDIRAEGVEEVDHNTYQTTMNCKGKLLKQDAKEEQRYHEKLRARFQVSHTHMRNQIFISATIVKFRTHKKRYFAKADAVLAFEETKKEDRNKLSFKITTVSTIGQE